MIVEKTLKMLRDTSVLQNYLLDEIKEDCLQDLMTVVLATEDAEESELETIMSRTTLIKLAEVLPISRTAMARLLVGLPQDKIESFTNLFLPITKVFY